MRSQRPWQTRSQRSRRRDSPAYDVAVRAVLRSFEEREAYLEDAAVADTVLVLQALAKPRDLAVTLSSPLLPP